MPNHLKFCGCRMCRAGRHRPLNKGIIRAAIRRLRHLTKRALGRGDEPPDKQSVGYTD